MINDIDLVLKFFLQLLAILVVCRLFGALFRRMGQTQVVGEMIAGIILGPSLLGWILPDVQNWLFPKSIMVAGQSVQHPSMSIFYVVSQFGLALYMFLVGVEFDVDMIKSKAKSAFFVSGAGIFVPMVAGGTLGYLLAGQANYFMPNVNKLSAAVFLGASMAITAFPMLARMIYENGLSKTSMGALALGAAAIDDLFAWCMLAVVLASVNGSSNYVLSAFGGAALLIALLLAIRKPVLSKFENWIESEGGLKNEMVFAAMAGMIACAWFTDMIGIHAVFGAFFFGAMLPIGKFSEALTENLSKFVTVVLVPMYFVYSGLNTKMGLLNSPDLIALTLGLIIVATLCKGGACALAARYAKESWRDSLKIGALMNTRGLVELIILNIGLKQGIITPTLFSMMVIVAVTTTIMATPLYKWLNRKESDAPVDAVALSA